LILPGASRAGLDESGDSFYVGNRGARASRAFGLISRIVGYDLAVNRSESFAATHNLSPHST
jgi:hypothetical protein